jgi:Domain of unknown function (DUF4388)
MPSSSQSDLLIGAGGELRLSAAARDRLAQGPGRYSLLSAGPELLVSLREGDAALSSEVARLEPGPVALSGDLSLVPPSELLNFLHQGRRTGLLLTRGGGVERSVVLTDGAVAWAASTSPAERFGELLCRMGLVPRASLDATLLEQAQQHNHRPIGQLLGERGLLEPDACWRGLRHQVIEIFLGLLVLKAGTFVFRHGLVLDRLPAQLALDIEGLLLDGLRRLDEMEFYRLRVPTPSLKPVRTGLAAPAEVSEAFTPEMARLLPLVDAARTIAELGELSALGEFEATKAACRLMQTGHLVALEPRLVTPPALEKVPSGFDGSGW